MRHCNYLLNAKMQKLCVVINQMKEKEIKHRLGSGLQENEIILKLFATNMEKKGTKLLLEICISY